MTTPPCPLRHLKASKHPLDRLRGLHWTPRPAPQNPGLSHLRLRAPLRTRCRRTGIRSRPSTGCRPRRLGARDMPDPLLPTARRLEPTSGRLRLHSPPVRMSLGARARAGQRSTSGCAGAGRAVSNREVDRCGCAGREGVLAHCARSGVPEHAGEGQSGGRSRAGLTGVRILAPPCDQPPTCLSAASLSPSARCSRHRVRLVSSTVRRPSGIQFRAGSRCSRRESACWSRTS